MIDPIVRGALVWLAKTGGNAIQNRLKEMKLEKAEVKKQEELRARAIIVCKRCRDPIGDNAICCTSCGKSEFTLLGTLLDEDAVNECSRLDRDNMARLQREERRQKEKARAEYRIAARKRRKYLESLRACTTCRQAYPSDHLFCGSCASSTEVFPSEQVFLYMKEDFPELVNVFEDLERL